MEPRNMSKTYRYMKSDDLQELWSRKAVRVRKLEKSFGYLDKQELRCIRFNMKQIEAELESRKFQLRLPI